MFLQFILLFIILPVCTVIFFFASTLLLIPFAFMFASWFMRIHDRKVERRKRDGAIIGIFHPYANAGGGGERVLWVAIKAIQTRYPTSKIHIYAVDEGVEPKTIFDKAQNTFNITIDRQKVFIVPLTLGKFIEAKTYPHFTLLMQSIGSMILGIEALFKLNPDIYIDTIGHAFTYPIFKYMAGCPVGCYTHYPTITSAMMRRVKQRVASYNNAGNIARNPLFTWIKLVYYKIFGWLYAQVGRCADVIMVNGTWTEDHINELWNAPLKTHRVYPPCEVGELKNLQSLVKESDPIRILSVAQFRPEKDHPLMLQSMYQLRNVLFKNEPLWNKIKLVLVGSCRNADDEERVKNLKDLSKHLAIEDNVQFHVNLNYSQLLEMYQRSSMAMHAMWNEHFGISVVECMAAGLITIAHKSGGPLCDIVETAEGSRNGFLAADPEEYANTILHVLSLDEEQKDTIRTAARSSVDRFSTAEFEKNFLRTIEPLMKYENFDSSH